MSFMDIYGISAVGVCTNKGLRTFMDRGTTDRALQELHDQKSAAPHHLPAVQECQGSQKGMGVEMG